MPMRRRSNGDGAQEMLSNSSKKVIRSTDIGVHWNNNGRRVETIHSYIQSSLSLQTCSSKALCWKLSKQG
jgi:hypothetical protein